MDFPVIYFDFLRVSNISVLHQPQFLLLGFEEHLAEPYLTQGRARKQKGGEGGEERKREEGKGERRG